MEMRRWPYTFFPILLSILVLVGCAKRPSMVQVSAPPPAGAAAAGVSTSEESGQGSAASASEGAGQSGATEPSGAAAAEPAGGQSVAAQSGAGGGQGAASSNEAGAAGATEGGAAAGGATPPGASSTASSSEGARGGGTTVTGPAGMEESGATRSAAGPTTASSESAGKGSTPATGPAGTESGAGEQSVEPSAEQMIVAARPAPKEYSAVADLQDVFFSFDKYTIRAEDTKILDANAAWLKSNPNYLLLIEGHCDERGTNEYNIALGQHRAKSAMDYLVSQGVLASRITTISYGEERPLCAEHTEECWAKNRRAHFLVKAQ